MCGKELTRSRWITPCLNYISENISLLCFKVSVYIYFHLLCYVLKSYLSQIALAVSSRLAIVFSEIKIKI